MSGGNNHKNSPGRRFIMETVFRLIKHPKLGELREYTGRTAKRMIYPPRPEERMFKKHDHIHSARERHIRKLIKENKRAAKIDKRGMYQYLEANIELYKELRTLTTPVAFR